MTPARFWARVNKTPSCWVWTGHAGKEGYGVLRVPVAGGRRRAYAHRFSYELHGGPIPEGLFVCHHCDNPPCVRPDHLFLGTHADNMRDAHHKGRHSGQVEDWAPNAKLTTRQIQEIREARDTGRLSIAQLATQYGVRRACVSRVARRVTWAWVPESAA